MQFSIDPNPIGAFIEYTLKPLIDYSRELLDELDKHGLKGKDIINYAFRLYILDIVVRVITSFGITGLICYTALRCLHITL